jgi:hypothetical protein
MTVPSEPPPGALGVPELNAKSDVSDTHYRLVIQNETMREKRLYPALPVVQ